MKVHVIYSSLSGCTRRLAEAIYEGLPTEDKRLIDLDHDTLDTDADVLLLGYWVDKGGPNSSMKALMEKLSGKTVGVFCTLAYYCDAEHGVQAPLEGVRLLKERNTIIGTYVCNGALSPEMIKRFRENTLGGHHSATPASEIRWEIFKNHPTEAETALGAERFCERVQMLKKFKEQDIPFKSLF